MPGLMMECTTCHRRFQSTISVNAAPGTTALAYISDNTDPCPFCKGRAVQVESGDFSIDEQGNFKKLATALLDPESTREDFEELRRVLAEAQAQGAGSQAVAQKIRTEAPRFVGVAAFFDSQRSANAAAWLGVAIAVLALLISLKSNDAPPTPAPAPTVNVTVQADTPTDEDVERWIGEAMEQQKQADAKKQRMYDKRQKLADDKKRRRHR